MNKFFQKDPEVLFEKVFCPYCNARTGEDTPCDKFDNDLGSYGVVAGGIPIPLPIFSKSCTFRKNNMWKVALNYPFSLPLAKRLDKIQGVEQLTASGKNGFQFVVSKLHPEDEIKKKVAETYRTFIKEIHSKETSLSLPMDEYSFVGIKFPNGQEYLPEKMTPEIADNILNLSSDIEGSSLIQKDFDGKKRNDPDRRVDKNKSGPA